MLGDLLRGTALDADAARPVVGRLVSLTVNEPVTKVRESALNSISEAFNHHRLPLDLVEPLDTDVPTTEPELLAHAVCIFDATHNPQARQLIGPSSTTPTLTWARKPAAQRPRSLNPIQKAAPTSLDDCSADGLSRPYTDPPFDRYETGKAHGGGFILHTARPKRARTDAVQLNLL